MDNSRTINEELLNKELIAPLIKEVIENKDKYFLAIRANKITIYYKGYILIDINCEKSGMNIELRKPSEAKSKDSILALNKEYIESLIKEGFISNEKNFKIAMTTNLDYKKLLDLGVHFIDNYYGTDITEKLIQGEISGVYQDLKDNRICIDCEYTEKFSEGKELKDKSNIKGRYDFIFLKKENDKYKIEFSELKIDYKACINPTTGIINHVNDINYYLESHKNNEHNTRDIIKCGILQVLKLKNELGIITNIDEKDIDFANPKFSLIFCKTPKMTKLPITDDTLMEILEDEIKSANRSNDLNKKEEMVKKPININGKLVPKNKISKGDYTDVFKMVKEHNIYIYNPKTKELN